MSWLKMPDKLLRVIAYASPHVFVLQIVIAVFVTWYIYRSCYRYLIYKVSIAFSCICLQFSSIICPQLTMRIWNGVREESRANSRKCLSWQYPCLPKVFATYFDDESVEELQLVSRAWLRTIVNIV